MTTLLSPLAISPNITVKELHLSLRKNKCSGCKLGEQRYLNGPVLYRGNEESVWAIIGEAPGREEDKHGLPFHGPAGKLLDQMLTYLKLPPELQPVITNVSMCRPIAPAGSGKENLRPQEIDAEVLQKCSPYLRHVIEKSGAKLIVLAGATAYDSFFPGRKSTTSFTSLLGNVYFNTNWPGLVFLPVYHPAFLLRKKNNPEAYKPYQEKTKQLLDTIKTIVLELS